MGAEVLQSLWEKSSWQEEKENGMLVRPRQLCAYFHCVRPPPTVHVLPPTVASFLPLGASFFPHSGSFHPLCTSFLLLCASFPPLCASFLLLGTHKSHSLVLIPYSFLLLFLFSSLQPSIFSSSSLLSLPFKFLFRVKDLGIWTIQHFTTEPQPRHSYQTRWSLGVH